MLVVGRAWKFHLSAVGCRCGGRFCALVDGAGPVGEIYTGNDVEIGGVVTIGCDGEEVVGICDGDSVKTARKSDFFKIIVRSRSVVSHDRAGFVEFRPAGG
mgnify:CR=1 FL=1